MGSGDCPCSQLGDCIFLQHGLLKQQIRVQLMKGHSPTQRVKFDYRSGNAGITENMSLPIGERRHYGSTMNCDATANSSRAQYSARLLGFVTIPDTLQQRLKKPISI